MRVPNQQALRCGSLRRGQSVFACAAASYLPQRRNTFTAQHMSVFWALGLGPGLGLRFRPSAGTSYSTIEEQTDTLREFFTPKTCGPHSGNTEGIAPRAAHALRAPQTAPVHALQCTGISHGSHTDLTGISSTASHASSTALSTPVTWVVSAKAHALSRCSGGTTAPRGDRRARLELCPRGAWSDPAPGRPARGAPGLPSRGATKGPH